MQESEASHESVCAIIAAISATDIKVVAEGIETELEAELCLQCGCHLGQGFFFGQPLSIRELFPPPDTSSLDGPE